MDKLNRLKGSIKATVTKLEAFVLEKKLSKDTTSSELEVKLKKVETSQKKLQVLKEQYYDIESLTEVAAIEMDLDETEDRLDELEVSLKILLDPFKNSVDAVNSSSRQNEIQPDLKTKVRLPEIPLPSFSGKCEEWSTFKTQFTQLITNNEELSESQKLYYLRASLKDDAKQIETAEDSFASLFTALTERFENQRLLVDTHLLAIINYEKIQHESTKELRSLIDCVKKNLRALSVLEYDQDKLSDVMLVNIILQKLDKETRKQFELTLKTTEVPQFEDLITFLESRSATLENISRNHVKTMNKNPLLKTKALMVNAKPYTKICVLCKGPHSLNQCVMFQKMDISKRYETVRLHKLCINCLNKNHYVRSCNSKYSCSICSKRHHSMLHRQPEANNLDRMAPAEGSQRATESHQTEEAAANSKHSDSLTTFQSLSNITRGNCKSILLSTALIFIEDANGKRIKIRCILDNGSNINCLTNECAEVLGLKRKIINAPVSGLNGSVCTIRAKINSVISNAEEDFRENADFFLVPKITELTPSTYLDISEVRLPNFIELADPAYFKPGKIHALIGAELFFRILKHNSIKINDHLIMQDTVFGWIPTGSLKETEPSEMSRCCLIRDCETPDDNLKLFWELESIGILHDDSKSPEDDQAEEIFNRTTTFINGRYEVQLPWKRDWRELSDNFAVAKRRLQSLQRKFSQDQEAYRQYSEIIEDYLLQGIIERVEENPKQREVSKPIYYLPHRAVYKQDKVTTKTRIVFDASSHDNGQLSLNDCLWPGRNLNPNLLDILIKFRLNKVAMSSDIEKAFLQISLAEKDRDAVRFLWFDQFSKEGKSLQIYRFKRVLFGVNASPFLLSATIRKHVEQFNSDYPTATRLLEHCLYVDDFISGEDSAQEALEISRNAKEIMQKAGMILRKWVTNDSSLMKRWSEEGFCILQPPNPISLGINLTKVLGMAWSTTEDCLTMEIDSLIEYLSNNRNTKRFLLQAVGKIFDPLGMLTPFTIRVKCLFQELWIKKVSWDGELPPEVQEEWQNWCAELPCLSQLKIPRNVLNSSKEETEDAVEIHSFCDASKRAYGAAVYLRILKEEDVEVNLIASKSRVAPLKQITLPRLELLGALLAARLTHKIKQILDLKVSSTVYYWTDSKITLYWIKGATKRWKQFVANRVKEINFLTEKNSWYHCPGKDNPADVVTRGIRADSLLDNTLWWKGPSFLTSRVLPNFGEDPCVPEEDYFPEMKKNFENSESPNDSKIMLSLNRVPDFLDFLFEISNKFLKIIRVLAYVFRFVNNCRGSTQQRTGPLSSEEMKLAENFFIKKTQSREFETEIKGLQTSNNVSPSSKIKNLSPFLDKDGLVRVGGRLTNSSISYSRKHPILLPSKGKLSNLIVQYYHEKYLHMGPQALLYQIRQKYWILNGRNLCRKIVHNCIQCFKVSPKPCYQKMGDLPKERTNPDFVFNSVGIDLCGPFFIKNQKRGSVRKIYTCIFICLVTKAIHLEIVSDLTSESMIATLKRFIARRGKCARILSDNGTNFVGANKELKEFYKLVSKQNDALSNFSAEENIEWKFIPPRAPNFGGLWEAGVKSFKYYFKRIVGRSNLTYEEFLTVMVQIEAMLNSRPLTPLSSEIEDLEILTPAHFLIGRPVTSIVEPSLVEIQNNRLNLWQRTTKTAQMVWKRWSNTYLNNLQQRTKWMFDKQNVKVGDMVLFKEENLPICKWALGRIIKLYPGKDEKIRVVDIKTKAGVLKRPVSKLCVLPLEN